MSRDAGAPAGGAVFVATRDGDLMIHADAGWAAGWMEAIDVDAGEYVAAYRVDGAVMAISTAGEQVQLDLTDEVDVAGLQAAIDTYERRVSDARRTSAVTALDYAEDWFAREWNRRAMRWPRWLDRRLHGSGPWTREQLRASPGAPRPGGAGARADR